VGVSTDPQEIKILADEFSDAEPVPLPICPPAMAGPSWSSRVSFLFSEIRMVSLELLLARFDTFSWLAAMRYWPSGSLMHRF